MLIPTRLFVKKGIMFYGHARFLGCNPPFQLFQLMLMGLFSERIKVYLAVTLNMNNNFIYLYTKYQNILFAAVKQARFTQFNL